MRADKYVMYFTCEDYKKWYDNRAEKRKGSRNTKRNIELLIRTMTRLLGDEPTKHSSNGDSRDREAWLVQVNELGARGEKLLMEQLPSEL